MMASQSHYYYLKGDDLEQVIFGGFHSRLKANTLCWVLQNKGKTTNSNIKGNSDNDGFHTTTTEHRRTELFLTARVVSDSNDDEDAVKGEMAEMEKNPSRRRRVLVRYAHGSTYRVRRCHLLPVLEPQQQAQQQRIILVVAETYEYRRAAVVHTCHSDLFLEIGCDFGMTVHRVQRALQSAPPIPIVPTTSDKGDNPNASHVHQESHLLNRNNKTPKDQSACFEHHPEEDVNKKYVCYGVDKSEESIAQAKTRFPDSCFAVQDALKGMPQLLNWWHQHGGGGSSPTVVAIDINGTRPLPAVQTCLALVVQTWQPRLVIVKSRELYAHIVNKELTQSSSKLLLWSPPNMTRQHQEQHDDNHETENE